MWQPIAMMKIRRSAERGHSSHGWLDTYHTFSFADYYDPQWMGFRSLRVINDDLVMPAMGFGTHPHRDMEIITYILSGALEHKDSMGNGRVIRAGEVQYMAAGTGVQHSEFNPASDEPVHLLQVWIQPDRKGVTPRYAERSLKDAAAGTLHLVTSKTGRDGSIAIHQDADLWLAKLAAGNRVTHKLAPGRHAWIHVAEGQVSFNGETLRGGDAVAVSEETALELSATLPAQVVSITRPTSLNTYATVDHSKLKTGTTTWRVVQGTGNCCENYLTATKKGRLLDFGGSFINYSDDRGLSWQQVRPLTPLVNGEGTIVVNPNGDVDAIGWDP